MSMLAERRRKTKWTINPTKKPIWTTDSDGIKFGKQLMEKMGWSAGKGLGVKEQGISEPLKVSYKNDTKGMGFKGNEEHWIEHQDEFNSFLAQLAGTTPAEQNHTENKKIKSLEEKSKLSKARVHYQKFTRGKDLSKYSENDLACILGSNKIKKEQQVQLLEEVKTENGYEKSFGVTTINSGSIADYFKKKWVTNKYNCENSSKDENIQDEDCSNYKENQVESCNNNTEPFECQNKGNQLESLREDFGPEKKRKRKENDTGKDSYNNDGCNYQSNDLNNLTSEKQNKGGSTESLMNMEVAGDSCVSENNVNEDRYKKKRKSKKKSKEEVKENISESPQRKKHKMEKYSDHQIELNATETNCDSSLIANSDDTSGVHLKKKRKKDKKKVSEEEGMKDEVELAVEKKIPVVNMEDSCNIPEEGAGKSIKEKKKKKKKSVENSKEIENARDIEVSQDKYSCSDENKSIITSREVVTETCDIDDTECLVNKKKKHKKKSKERLEKEKNVNKLEQEIAKSQKEFDYLDSSVKVENENVKEKREKKKKSKESNAVEIDEAESVSVDVETENSKKKKRKRKEKVSESEINEKIPKLEICEEIEIKKKSEDEDNLKNKTNSGDVENNVVYTHKTQLYRNKKIAIQCPENYTNERVLSLICGAEIGKFKGSNLGKLKGYGVRMEAHNKTVAS